MTVVFDGDDYTLYEVNRAADKWAVQLGTMMNSADASRLLKDCEIATTHYAGRAVELRLPRNHKYEAYNRKRGIVVGPPRNGRVFVSVEANQRDRKIALDAAKQRRKEWNMADVSSKNSSGKRRKDHESPDGHHDDMFSVVDSDGNITFLLPILAKYVGEPSRIPGQRFGNEYTARNNDTLELIGNTLGFAPASLLELNKEFYPGLRTTSKLQTGTKILLQVVDQRQND